MAEAGRASRARNASASRSQTPDEQRPLRCSRRLNWNSTTNSRPVLEADGNNTLGALICFHADFAGSDAGFRWVKALSRQQRQFGSCSRKPCLRRSPPLTGRGGYRTLADFACLAPFRSKHGAKGGRGRSGRVRCAQSPLVMPW